MADPARAKTFYSSVLGWECAPTGTPSPLTGADDTVHMFSKGKNMHGAFIHMPQDSNCHVRAWDAQNPGAMAVLTTYNVDSIEDTLALAETHGGKVHVYVC